MSIDPPKYSIDPPSYDKIEKSQWKAGQDMVIDEAKNMSGRLVKRVNTFTDRFGYSESSVMSKIIDDKMFASNFVKEPRRTGLHEGAAADWIMLLPNVIRFKRLPKGGINALKVSRDGNIEKVDKNKQFPGKTLDFQWHTGEITCYAMHKFTKEGGGNQDSQYEEMKDLMQRFQLCQHEDIVLFVIVDGLYYETNEKRKLKKLQKLEKGTKPYSYATPIEGLPNLLNKLI